MLTPERRDPEMSALPARQSVGAGLVVTALVLVLAGGCGPKVPEPVDLNDAGHKLSEVLQAWKEERPYDSLAGGNPPVVFNEPLWQNGTRLLAFELGKVELEGRQGRCTAKLKLQSKEGKQYERNIGYQIDTVPRVVIVREGLGP